MSDTFWKDNHDESDQECKELSDHAKVLIQLEELSA